MTHAQFDPVSRAISCFYTHAQYVAVSRVFIDEPALPVTDRRTRSAVDGDVCVCVCVCSRERFSSQIATNKAKQSYWREI